MRNSWRHRGSGGTASGEEKPAIKENIKLQSTWMRGLYLLLFLIIWGIAKTLVIAVMIFQFSVDAVRRAT